MDKENFGLQITDEDIEWVRTIMPDIELDECRIQILKNMNSVDIHACPGSGKTTILVAKLAILSRKWKWQNRGICVLSHTNVAREEIEERLGTLNVGKKLLSYPHFIGTFQAFLDTFIAMPFLRSCGCPVNIIDTDYVLERRWKSIRIKKWLEAHGKDKYVCDPLELPYKLDVKLGTGTATYKNVVKSVTESRRRGDVIKYTDARKDEFLFWNGSEKPEEYTKNRNRVNEKEYENESGDKINIKFGSIHSSKGRTHLATLVVETKYYEDNLSSILPWLSGKRPKLGVRNKKRLKCHYVAMTRAKGLLCLAIPRKSVSDQVRKELENFGWNLEVV